jgi:hypothetical protein
MDLTEAKTGTNMLFIDEKKPSAKGKGMLAKNVDIEDDETSVYGQQDDNLDRINVDEEEEFSRLEFKFRNSVNNSEMIRIFKVKIMDKKF